MSAILFPILGLRDVDVKLQRSRSKIRFGENVQDRYAGDVGDFIKLGLLRHLTSPVIHDWAGFRLGINWYLTPDEAHNADGKHVGYLSRENGWHGALRACDPDLMRCLSEVVARERSVAALESSGALPADSSVYREVLRDGFDDGVRRRWHAQAVDCLGDAEVVFADPDNGVRVASRGSKSHKYALLHELADYARLSQSLVVYHHADRSADAQTQARRRLDELAVGVDQYPVGAIIGRRGTCRFFLVTATDMHHEALSLRLRDFATRWAAHVDLATVDVCIGRLPDRRSPPTTIGRSVMPQGNDAEPIRPTAALNGERLRVRLGPVSGLNHANAKAFIAAIPDGCWASYKDVATAAGNPDAARPIGMWLRQSGGSIPKYWRVLYSSGFVADGLVSHAPGLPRDSVSARDLLKREGVRFDYPGRASQRQRFRVEDWRSPRPDRTTVARVVTPPTPTGIQVGATNRVRDLDSEEARTWTLVPKKAGLTLPEAIAHADWGTAQAKRMVATAELGLGGVYVAHEARIVGQTGALRERMHVAGTPRTVLLGFDFPIGVPRAYAARAGIENFATWLRGLNAGAPLFTVADDISDVSIERPFFPRNVTEKSPGLKEQFRAALGLSPQESLRRCDAAHAQRGAASEMFWTLGPKAVGKATLAGWRDAIKPALSDQRRRHAIWPFDGPLFELIDTFDIVIVETYPTEFYRRLGLQIGKVGHAKTSQEARRAAAPPLLAWCGEHGVLPDDELAGQILDGFGPAADGEDPFDAVVGLLGMIATVRAAAEPELPDDPAVRQVEGWMFGQPAPLLLPHAPTVGPVAEPKLTETPILRRPVQAPNPLRPPCLCGCGNVPRGRHSRFMPGHDQRINPATGRRFNDHDAPPDTDHRTRSTLAVTPTQDSPSLYGTVQVWALRNPDGTFRGKFHRHDSYDCAGRRMYEENYAQKEDYVLVDLAELRGRHGACQFECCFKGHADAAAVANRYLGRGAEQRTPRTIAVPPPRGIRVGAEVLFRDSGTGETKSRTIVRGQRADPARGEVSTQSPIGRALLGREVGEIVQIELPRGTLQVEVVAVRPQT